MSWVKYYLQIVEKTKELTEEMDNNGEGRSIYIEIPRDLAESKKAMSVISNALKKTIKHNLKHKFSIRLSEPKYERSDDEEYRDKYKDICYIDVTARRDLPGYGTYGTFIHVMNKYFEDPVRAIRNLMKIDGEICASLPIDDVFSTRKTFFGVVMSGMAHAIWEVDVYSSIDLIGNRIYGESTGSERTEAWIAPSECKLEYVITSSESILEKCNNAGIECILIKDRESLSKEERSDKDYTDYEEEEYPERKYGSIKEYKKKKQKKDKKKILNPVPMWARIN